MYFGSSFDCKIKNEQSSSSSSNNNNSLYSPCNFLNIIEQRAVIIDTVKDKNIYVVVKNSPFVVNIGFSSNKLSIPSFSLDSCNIDTILVYEHTKPEKEVTYISVKPIQTNIKINDTKDKITLDCKISVLTSQHEDSLFKIKIIINDSNNNPLGYIYSYPIRVVSKTSQAKKTNSKPRITPSMIHAKIKAIEDRQTQQYNTLVSQLVLQDTNNNNYSSSSLINPNDTLSNSLPLITQQQQDNIWDIKPTQFMPSPQISSTIPASNTYIPSDIDNFNRSFDRFMKCYYTLTNEQKLAHFEKLRTEFSEQDKQLLSHFLDIIEQYIKENGCQCNPCPYEKQANDFVDANVIIDSLYNDNRQ